MIATANNDPQVNIKSQKVSALQCQTFWNSGGKPLGGGGEIHPRYRLGLKKRIMVKSSEVSWQPLLVYLVFTFSVLGVYF